MKRKNRKKTSVKKQKSTPKTILNPQTDEPPKTENFYPPHNPQNVR